MERRIVNPWTWQDQFGFVQANEVTGGQRVVYCAGQASIDADGRPVHAGDISAQVQQSLDNLETVLKAAGMDLSNVVRLSIYTTDMQQIFTAYPAMVGRFTAAGCRPASTLLGISALAFPELLVEIEATAVG